jgi:tetratricopeptide (TPR) repeat protein
MAQSGLVSCVEGMINDTKSHGPDAALKETTRLVEAHPNDPGVLLAHATASRVMDNIYGKEGMQGALEQMQRTLAETGGPPALAAYAAAIQWNLAGRPDLARKELGEKVLKVGPTEQPHLPSLLLLGRLAVTDEDWGGARRVIDVVEKLQPDLRELPLWKAALHAAQGETKEAIALYEQFVEKNPALSTGYLALAGVYEQEKKYKEALEWVRKWRTKQPDDLIGFRAEVRVLARDGQVKKAEEIGEAFLKDQMRRLQENLAEAEKKAPAPKDEKEKEQRAKAKEDALIVGELSVVRAISGGFHEGRAYADAERWLRERGLPLVEKLPEPARKNNRVGLQMVLGTLYVEQARDEKDKAKRAALADKAIAIYQQVWKDSPGNVAAGNNLAWLLNEEKDNPGAALNIIEEVRKGRFSQQPITGERMNLEVLDTLGTILRANGKNEEAEQLFQEATQRYGGEPRVLVHLGKSQLAAGKGQEAYKSLQVAITIAETKARSAAPDRKAKLEEIAADAREVQRKIKTGIR